MGLLRRYGPILVNFFLFMLAGCINVIGNEKYLNYVKEHLKAPVLILNNYF
jgi:hypothetical protein